MPRSCQFDLRTLLSIFFVLFSMVMLPYILYNVLVKDGQSKTRFQEAIEERTVVPEDERTYREAFNLAEVYQYGKAGTAPDSGLAFKFYQEALDKSTDTRAEGACHMGLGSLYENEIDPPDAHAAIKSYLNAVECGYEEGGLRIAKIYTVGMHPYYVPNKMEAMKLYKGLENVSPTLHPWCKLAIKDIGALRYDPDAFAQEHHRQLPDDIVGTVIDRIRNRRGETVPYTEPPPWFDQEIPEDSELDLLEDARDVVERKLPKQRIRNDSQNVHDHAMLNAANANLNLAESLPSTPDAYQRCADTLRSALSSDGKRVLDSLSATPHSRFDKSERDVLLVVWDRIHAPENEPRKEDMMRALRENLESGVESGHVVCSTGKIMRLLSTLEVLDEKAQIMRPEWAIREEIGRKVGMVLQRKLESAEQSVREAYMTSDPTPKEQELAENLRDRVRREVEGSVSAEYRDVIEPERLTVLTQSMLEFI